ncbi:MAG: glutamate synthase [Porticoccaceae bacterium]|nr:glutamate synthase [Porticoccaceae bacterium]
MTKGVPAAKRPSLETVTEGNTYYWCACGLSKNQPFCDGSHAGSEFNPLAWTAEKSGTVAFCVCKQTDNAPLCDGAHTALPEDE